MGSNGFSIYLPDLLMLSLNDYKYKVLSSSQFNNEIKKFKIKVNIKKSDDLWIQFYCKEFVDYNGVPRYNFKDTADLKYSVNKKCQIIALNGSKLDEYKIWEFGTSDKPEGTKTCDYYINKFIEVAEKNNNNSKKINIRIPFKPDGYVNPDTKPIYKDSLITEIIFTSSSAMVGFGLDKTPSTLTLTESTFTFQSGNTNENYSIIEQKYDEEMNMQDFLLADKTGQSKHKVSIAFSKSMNSYLIIFSKNNSDLEYQFQNIEVKSIKRK